MAVKYSDCYFCGGEVDEERINREIWWREKLHLIEGVPTGICRQCGHKVLLPDVAKQIDKILAGRVAPHCFLQVPSYQFPEARAV